MLRIVLFYLLPFLLPFIGFFAYRFLVTRGQALLDHTPWFVLTLVGLGLVIATLLSLALSGGGRPGFDYVPPRFEGGRVVPGEIRAPLADPGTADDAAAGAPGG